MYGISTGIPVKKNGKSRQQGSRSVYESSTGIPENDPGSLLTAGLIERVRDEHGSTRKGTGNVDGRVQKVCTRLAQEYQTRIQENLTAELVQCVRD